MKAGLIGPRLKIVTPVFVNTAHMTHKQYSA